MHDTGNLRPPPGLLLVVSSPSGAGKTTLCHLVLREFDTVSFSVSFTTRARRHNEVDGRDYSFVDDQTFDQMVDAGQFAEWAHVHGNRYGTARNTIDQSIASGGDLIFDIDWQGASAIKQQYPDDTVLVLVVPPSLGALAERLRTRGTDSEPVIERRLGQASEELARHGQYQYIVINDDLDDAYGELRAIYLAERCALRRRVRFARALSCIPDGQ